MCKRLTSNGSKAAFLMVIIFRDGKWTESIAVGSEPFIQNVKVLMGGMVLGRKVLESGESFQLKEVQYPYIAHFGAK
jgi:putative transposase